jgi:hypothetical protein
VPKPGSDALTELQSLLADDDNRVAGELRRPVRDGAEGAADGTWHEARIGREVLIDLDVDQGRAVGSADEASKLVRGDGVD